MDQFDRAARHAKTVEAMQAAWHRTMKTTIAGGSAKRFVEHYRDMTKRSNQRGGSAYALSGASTDYVMGPGQAGSVSAPGFPVQAAFGPVPYGHFTDDVTADPSFLRQIGGPVEIPKIAQNADCGVDRYPTMAEARMAQVGAGRRTRTSRRNRRSVGKRSKSRSRRSSRRAQRGGNLLVALNPMNWTNGLGAQSVNNGPMDRVPGEHQWAPVSNGTTMFPTVNGVSHVSANPPAASITSWAPARFT